MGQHVLAEGDALRHMPWVPMWYSSTPNHLLPQLVNHRSTVRRRGPHNPQEVRCGRAHHAMTWTRPLP